MYSNLLEMQFLKEQISTQGFTIYYSCIFFVAGAIKEIQIRVPEIVQLYCLGNTSNVVHSAVNLDKKLEESSTGRPETNHSKSMAGNKTIMSSSHYNNNYLCCIFCPDTSLSQYYSLLG